jgi:hypothetical protein
MTPHRDNIAANPQPCPTLARAEAATRAPILPPTQSQQQPPPSQFAQTPRFSTPRRPPPAPSPRPDVRDRQHAATPSSAPRRGLKLSRVESIDDASQSPPPELEAASDEAAAESDGDGNAGIERDTFQRKHLRGDDFGIEDGGWHFTATHSPKRRRLSHTTPSPPRDIPTNNSTSPLRFVTPARPVYATQFRETPAPSTATSTRRFFAPPAAHPANPQPFATPARPTFLRPAAPTPDQAPAPLPEAFSPRKNTKDIPGGMAAEVRGWIAEISGTAIARRYAEPAQTVEVRTAKQLGSKKDAKGFVRGSQGESMLLLGPGKGGDVAEGKTVGLWPPTWQVEVDGEKWNVGVDWKVVDDTQTVD